MKKFFPQLSRKILIFLFLLFFSFFSLFCLKDRLFPSWDTRFEDFTNELFCQELSANTLNLHYTLAYPEKYQIKDYGISLGSMNPKKMQENFASVKALKKQLEKYPFSKLSPENQQLFDMLRLHLATELSCEDCYMLQEPLGPNLGGFRHNFPYYWQNIPFALQPMSGIIFPCFAPFLIISLKFSVLKRKNPIRDFL